MVEIVASQTREFGELREPVLNAIRDARERICIDDKRDAAVFVGINNKGLMQDGTRVEDEPLMRCFDEDEWKRELMIYNKANLKVKGIEPFKEELTQVVTIPELDDDPLAIRYYGIEVKEGVLPPDHPALEMDSRAPIMPQVLTDTKIAWPFLYVYAEIKSVMMANVTEIDDVRAKTKPDEAARVLAAGLLRDWSMSKESDDEPDTAAHEVPTPSPALMRPPPSPQQRRRTVTPAIDVAAGDGPGAPSAACAFDVQAAHWDTGSPEPVSSKVSDKRTMEALHIDAKQAAASGDHKEAYALMEKAIAMACGGLSRDVPTAHEMEYAPMREEAPHPPSGQTDVKRSFKPVTSYELADGNTHVIPAGLYSEDEWFAKTLEAQELVAASNRAVKRTEHIHSMSKYEGPPLARSESMLATAERVDGLKETIKHKAERARNVMEASRSKESSPTQAPTEAPELPGTSELADLGQSLAEGVAGIKIDIKAEQQAKWDAAAASLEAQAASIWGPKA